MGTLIGKETTPEVPPPGPGLTTVTNAVPTWALSEAGMAARNCEPLTIVVTRGLPFHVTTEPGTNPVPLTVSVKSGPPGMVQVGTRGWLIRVWDFLCR